MSYVNKYRSHKNDPVSAALLSGTQSATDLLATRKGLRAVGVAGRVASLPFTPIRETFGNVLGQITEGSVGRGVGGAIGEGVGHLTGRPKEGRAIGSKFTENLLGFRKGGRVKKTGKYLVHKREYVLKKGSKPTKMQKQKVMRRRTK